MPEEKPTQKPTREPQALSSEYHKARKQAMLWAGVLFIWELVGVDLAKAEASGGNLGAVISAIKSPRAIPWALLILVGYFLFKLWVEWNQCNAARRSIRVSRIDYFSAWVVSLAAFVLYFGQRASRNQFADFLQKNPTYTLSVTMGVMVGFPIGLTIWEILKRWRTEGHLRVEGIDVVMGLLLTPILPVMLVVGHFLGISLGWRLVPIGISSGIIIGILSQLPLPMIKSRLKARALQMLN